LLKERLHFLKGNITHKLLRKPKIFWATIYLTYACNYRCKHCYGKYGETYGVGQNSGITLDFSQIKFIVGKLKQYGCCYISLLGGEPLLHRDIKEIIKLIKSCGMELSIITNGSLVKRKMDEIKEVSNLTLSIDGNEDANDFLRGGGAYMRSLEAIAEAKKHRINCHINVTIYKQSINNMDNLFEYAKANKIYLGFCPLMYQSYLNDSEEYLRPSDEDYRRFYAKIILLKNNTYPIIYSIEAYKTLLNWSDFNRVVILKDEPLDLKKINFPSCRAGNDYIYIGAKGDVYPCSQLIGTNIFNPKNIFNDGFEAAWEHAKDLPCKACTSIGFLDVNMILSLKLRPSFAMINQSFKEFRYSRRR
jgi:MoaA/NifB/PqqE/SkfB family radical SAM enzyme